MKGVSSIFEIKFLKKGREDTMNGSKPLKKFKLSELNEFDDLSLFQGVEMEDKRAEYLKGMRGKDL